MGDASSAPLLIAQSKHEDDPELQLSLLSAAYAIGGKDAIPLLFDIINDDGIFADEAKSILRQKLPSEVKELNDEKLFEWWNKNNTHVFWDQSKEVYGINK